MVGRIAEALNGCSEIERALRLFHGPARHAMSIDHRSPDIGVAQQGLDGADIVIGLKEMGGKTVTEGMGPDPLRKFCFSHRCLNRLLNM